MITAGSEVVRRFDSIDLEGINGFRKPWSGVAFEPRCGTPRILIRQRHQSVFHRVLMDIVQSRQPRILERQASVPELVNDPPAGSGINAIESYRQFAMQMPHEITMRRRRVFEVHNDVVVIRKESPRLQKERIVFLPARRLCRAEDRVLRRNRTVVSDAALPR
jgi:hypothetical protein